jgi:hypothetical protein
MITKVNKRAVTSMGNSRRKQLDPNYGKSYRITESTTHIVGIPTDRLTRKYTDIKALANEISLPKMSPSVVKAVMSAVTRSGLDRYIVLSLDPGEIGRIVSIDAVMNIVTEGITMGFMHSCLAQDLNDIFASSDNANTIEHLELIHDEQDCHPLYLDLMKSMEIESFALLTVHHLERPYFNIVPNPQ